jgi:PilZ domain
MKSRVSLSPAKEEAIAESPQTRMASRIRLQIPIFLRGYDAKGLEFVELTRTLNISAKGACITSTHILRLGQSVQLTIPSPATSSSSMVPSETPPIMAKVRRQQALGDLRVFGLEFVRALE